MARAASVPGERQSPGLHPVARPPTQFGQGYSRLRDFRAIFLKTLKIVMTQHPRAKLHADEKGLVLHFRRRRLHSCLSMCYPQNGCELAELSTGSLLATAATLS